MGACLLRGKNDYRYFSFSSFTQIIEHRESCLKASIPKLTLTTFRERCVFVVAISLFAWFVWFFLNKK